MSGRPPPPKAPAQAPQFSLPKYTPEEQFVQKKQGELIQGDVRMLSQCDTERPFLNVEDAVKRLLPFHLFGAVDASEADLDESYDHAGSGLMSNRHEAWQELSISKVNELRRRADTMAGQITALEQQIDADALAGNRPLDRFAMVKLQQEDLKRKVAAEKTKLAQLMPAQPVVVAAPAPAAAVSSSNSKGAVAAAPAQIVVAPGQQGALLHRMQQQQLAVAAAQQQAINQLPPAQRQQYLQQLQLQQAMALQQIALQQQLALQQQQQMQQAKK